MRVEGGAGLALAGFLQEQDRCAGKRVVIILCGANIGLSQLRDILAS